MQQQIKSFQNSLDSAKHMSSEKSLTNHETKPKHEASETALDIT